MSQEETGSTKRTRASGEVLEYLIREFHQNHNPSPDMRKEISERTNMSEKAVRIWFQNRRAKARKVEKYERSSSAANSISGPSGSGPSAAVRGRIRNSNGTLNGGSIHSSRSNSLSINDNVSQMSPNNLYLSQFNHQPPIEINEKYCFIDCSSLSVGSWQRIKSGFHDEPSLKANLVNLSPFTLNSVMANVDLLVLLSKRNHEINYFFSAISNNSKILFRIFYPISSILSCSLLDNNLDKENNELRVSLSHSPKFSVYFFDGINSNSNQWSLCDDFSENQQVSAAYTNHDQSSPNSNTSASNAPRQTIPHVLVGVKNSLQYLNSFILENNQLQPHHLHHPIHPLSQAIGPSNSSNDENLDTANPQNGIVFNPDDLWDPTNTTNDQNHHPNKQSHPDPQNLAAAGRGSTGGIGPFEPNNLPPHNHHSNPYTLDGDVLNYRLKGLSPLGDFDSDTSPNSITSNNSHHHINHETSTINNSKRNSRTMLSQAANNNLYQNAINYKRASNFDSFTSHNFDDQHFSSQSNPISTSNSASNLTNHFTSSNQNNNDQNDSNPNSNNTFPSTAPTSASANDSQLQPEHYNELFNPNTPDFFSTVQTPTSTIINYSRTFPNNPPSAATTNTTATNNNTNNVSGRFTDFINSPTTSTHAYTHHHETENGHDQFNIDAANGSHTDDQQLKTNTDSHHLDDTNGKLSTHEEDSGTPFTLGDPHLIPQHNTPFDFTLHNAEYDAGNDGTNHHLTSLAASASMGFDTLGITSPSGSTKDGNNNNANNAGGGQVDSYIDFNTNYQ